MKRFSITILVALVALSAAADPKVSVTGGTIRGTEADGVVGPDLTHVGSRLTLGAGRLGNEPGDFARWIARTDHLKPSVRMPHFGMLPADERRALAAWLDGLE